MLWVVVSDVCYLTRGDETAGGYLLLLCLARFKNKPWAPGGLKAQSNCPQLEVALLVCPIGRHPFNWLENSV